MIKLLIGGSPCTFWSIAQKNNRETKADGMGWELFKNYLIAKEKFNPDFFLYENNKSADEAIKDQIKIEFGVTDDFQLNFFIEDTGVRYIEINSALVSAQNRERFYVHNCGLVELPKDRGILLRDILENEADGIGIGWRGRIGDDGRWHKKYESNGEQKANALTTAKTDSMVAIRVKEATQKGFVDVAVGECVDLTQPNSKTRRGRLMKYKSNCLMTSCEMYQYCGTIDNPLFEVKNGFITINGEKHKIKLVDGYYIFRKFSVKECCRLQTMPDDYCRAVSEQKALHGLGNGWTAEVIMHILNGALATVPKDEEIVVLSMYDGIGTGRYCLEKMGFTNIKYFAYEIDKYAIKIAKSNYPDIIEMGDAFAVRQDDWKVI